jgi:hypothetical protein
MTILFPDGFEPGDRLVITWEKGSIPQPTPTPTPTSTPTPTPTPAVTIKSITLEPESLRFSDTATITVVLTGPAPAPGLDVRMSFTSPVVFGIPVALPTLPIASGSSDGQISVPVSIIQASLAPNGFSPPGDVAISATAGAVTKTATLRIVP